MQLDAKALAAATAEIVKTHVSSAVAPLLMRIEKLESRPAPERGEKGERGEPGTPGADVASALIDRSGVLFLTLSNGETREIGPVVGRDGVDGKDGAPGERGERGEAGEKGDTGEQGPQGEPGKDGRDGSPGADGQPGEKGLDGQNGRDGFSLTDFDVEPVDHRTIRLSFGQGEERLETDLKFPVVIDRGVFKAGDEYEPGDGVTWGGSFWIAQEKTADKPDSGNGWRLAVKKGRDGKDAK